MRSLRWSGRVVLGVSLSCWRGGRKLCFSLFCGMCSWQEMTFPLIQRASSRVFPPAMSPFIVFLWRRKAINPANNKGEEENNSRWSREKSFTTWNAENSSAKQWTEKPWKKVSPEEALRLAQHLCFFFFCVLLLDKFGFCINFLCSNTMHEDCDLELDWNLTKVPMFWDWRKVFLSSFPPEFLTKPWKLCSAWDSL